MPVVPVSDHKDHDWEDFGRHLVFSYRCKFPGCNAWFGTA